MNPVDVFNNECEVVPASELRPGDMLVEIWLSYPPQAQNTFLSFVVGVVPVDTAFIDVTVLHYSPSSRFKSYRLKREQHYTRLVR